MDTKSDPIWDMFPVIFCINLKSRDDRYLSAVETMVNMNLNPSRVKFYRPEKDPRGGRFGCAESHMECARQAYLMGAPYALILEDDIVPEPNWREQLLKVQDFLKRKEPFDILRLYSMVRFPLQQVHKDIWRVGALSTAAYVVSRPFMDRLLHLKYTGVHIDALHVLAAERMLDIYPPVFNVSDASSDIEWAVRKDKNTSFVANIMFHVNNFVQTSIAGRRSIDLTNKFLAVCPKQFCSYAYKKWLLGIIEGNEISDELAKQLKISEIVNALKSQ